MTGQRPPPSRVMVDTRSMIGPRAGVGRYTAELVRRLPSLMPAVKFGYHTFGVADRPPPDRDGSRGAGSGGFIATLKRAPFARPVGRALSAALALRATRGDLYWAPNHVVPRGVRCRRTVVTVHDLSWLLHPAWHPPDRVALFSRGVPRSVQRSDAVISVSETMRLELIERFRLPPARIRVIHNGIDPEVFRPRSAAEASSALLRLGVDKRRYLLAVGTLEPRKNLETLLSAWSRLGPSLRREHELLIVGGEGWRDESLQAALGRAGADVRLLGRVGENDLACLYARATALVYPSVYEGFGLPPLEALASGTLPIVADLPVMRETLGEHGLLYGAPLHREALESALEAVLSGPVADDALRNQRRAAAVRYTWEASAAAHARLFAELV